MPEITEREHQVADAKDFIRTETQRNLRMYRRRIQAAAEARFAALNDTVNEDGTLPAPMDAARDALKLAEQKLLGA